MEPPPMDRQVAEIASEPDRAAAYARLLLLQRGCADDASSAAELAAELPSTLLPLLLRDAAADDEAVAASALKCLGFALYHPVLVSTISDSLESELHQRVWHFTDDPIGIGYLGTYNHEHSDEG
ncbi:Telomere-associated protein RIF1 [Zea mays]|uniref:Telomere-associated protein RIF1 n=1 Tax=Zea mays TaxID=4577 RepID=A0A1D6NU53_MAIZE|nr:Telomere-associated protein RIF1 [Zea mays]AQL01704.1 Telomere-associated protein RIF1 [Zea mays]AQL01709.1 Telomere-associated protein RIF1 [Zea mays]